MNKKIAMIAVFALVTLVTLVAALYFLLGPGKPATESGNGDFTVVVIHSDSTERSFTYTATGKLGEVLESEGLIDSEGADPGMFHTVDGEKADWNENQSYWAFYVGEDYAMTGIYATDIEPGITYKLVYTIG